MEVTIQFEVGASLRPETQSHIDAAKFEANNQLIAASIDELKRSGSITPDEPVHVRMLVLANGGAEIAYATVRGRLVIGRSSPAPAPVHGNRVN